jgi:thimet oligopeptidase
MRFTLSLAVAALVACTPSRQQVEPARSAEQRARPIPPPDGAQALIGTIGSFAATCDRALREGKAHIDRLKAMPPPRSVAAALAAYDDGVAAYSDVGGMASIAENSHPDAEFRRAAQRCMQQIEQALIEISLDRAVYDALAGLDLRSEDAATQRWIERTLSEFRRSGVDRDDATRARVKQLNDDLVKVGQEFSTTIREDVRFVELEPSALAGLPEDYVRAHAPGANGKVRITTDYPDYVPFMSYAKSAQAREAMWRTYRQRGYPRNVDTLARLASLRHELATLLGYPSWAALVTEDKMIRTPDAAAAFIERITTASEARMKRDYAMLLVRKKQEVPGATAVDPWDQSYLEERVKAEQYAFDSQAVRPYFEYERVKQGVLDITGRLFGITYRRVKDAPVWHPDIEAYDVFEGTTQLGRFYLDMHPRANKYKHAAQFDLVTGQAGRRYPEAVLMCNFPQPGAEPALMQHSDVTTFFHEFGHLLHHILGGHTRWAGISGGRTERDFIEAPSQLLEEWTRDADSLRSFARHNKTGEELPLEQIQRMKAADAFGRGIAVRHQMFYAATSLQLFSRDPRTLDATALVSQLQERYTPFRYAPRTYFHLSFGHLHGYSAAYYTYMWSLVIAKDLFTRFEREGLMSVTAARAYRQSVLEQGGSKDAAMLVKDFLGRDYGFEAYERWLNAEG